MMFCVPFALKIITGKSYEECERLLQSQVIGDVKVEGIYLPAVIDVLKPLGYELKSLKADGSYSLQKFSKIKGTFLCEVKGHAVVIINGRLFDNAHPNGSNLNRSRIIRAFEVIKRISDGIL